MGMFNTLTDHCKLVTNGEIDYYVIDRMDEVKIEMLRLLKVVDNICRDKGLKYWIDGGTLIGAIRHGGFIPWDDDIDISLLKPDYLRLIEELEIITKDTEAKEYLRFSGEAKYDHSCNYLCSKKNLYGRIKGSFGFVPVKLDIRPANIINCSEEDIKLNKELREIANEWIFRKRHLELSEISRKYQNMGKRDFFKFYNEKYGKELIPNGMISFPYYEFAAEDIYLIDIFKDVISVNYENTLTYIPNGFDEYLKSLYGNYMDLPPLEKRVPAQYEYIEFTRPFNNIYNLIYQPNHNKFVRLFKNLRLYGLNKSLKIIFEKLKGK